MMAAAAVVVIVVAAVVSKFCSVVIVIVVLVDERLSQNPNNNQLHVHKIHKTLLRLTLRKEDGDAFVKLDVEQLWPGYFPELIVQQSAFAHRHCLQRLNRLLRIKEKDEIAI